MQAIERQERNATTDHGAADQALAGLVRRETPRLLELARHLLGDEGEARAAVQDAFVSTCRTLSSFEAPADVSTSLRRSTVRAALERMHGRPAPATAIERLLPAFTEDGRHSPSPTRWPVATPGPAASEDRDFVRSSIAGLPHEYRTVLLLHDIEGLKSREIAHALGLQDDLVKRRLHRARQALRTLLAERFASPSADPSPAATC